MPAKVLGRKSKLEKKVSGQQQQQQLSACLPAPSAIPLFALPFSQYPLFPLAQEPRELPRVAPNCLCAMCVLPAFCLASSGGRRGSCRLSGCVCVCFANSVIDVTKAVCRWCLEKFSGSSGAAVTIDATAENFIIFIGRCFREHLRPPVALSFLVTYIPSCCLVLFFSFLFFSLTSTSYLDPHHHHHGYYHCAELLVVVIIPSPNHSSSPVMQLALNYYCEFECSYVCVNWVTSHFFFWVKALLWHCSTLSLLFSTFPCAHTSPHRLTTLYRLSLIEID